MTGVGIGAEPAARSDVGVRAVASRTEAGTNWLATESTDSEMACSRPAENICWRLTRCAGAIAGGIGSQPMPSRPRLIVDAVFLSGKR